MQEKVYKHVGDRELKLYIYNPVEPTEDRAAILFFHGGSYVKSDKTPFQFQHHAKLYASKGIVSICVDYRTANDMEDFSPLHAISDAKSSVQWVRQYHQELGVEPHIIIMSGVSYGGYTVLCSILSEGLYGVTDNVNINHIPNALIMFNHGVNRVEIINRLFPKLNDKANQLSPLHNIRRGLPPIIWFIGTGDITFKSNKEFYEKWIEYENKCSLHTYERMPHGFINYGAFDNKPFSETNNEIEKFLISLGYLN
jgi:acetyl esterase